MLHIVIAYFSVFLSKQTSRTVVTLGPSGPTHQRGGWLAAPIHAHPTPLLGNIFSAYL